MFLPLSSFLAISASANGYSQNVVNRYPNELPGYRFYATAKWKSLEPLISTLADVRKVFGKPTREVDLSQYFEPYPGDDRAKNPVLTYGIDDRYAACIRIRGCRRRQML